MEEIILVSKSVRKVKRTQKLGQVETSKTKVGSQDEQTNYTLSYTTMNRVP